MGAENVGVFNTAVDIKLKQWADKHLPQRCVTTGWETLHDKFKALVDARRAAAAGNGQDDIFDRLTEAVREASMARHSWDTKAEQSLRVMQVNTLEDRSVPDKHQWDSAIRFMESALKDKLDQTERQLQEMTGPGAWDQWVYWRYRTQEQKDRHSTLNELEKLIQAAVRHKPVLSYDEVTAVRKNLENQSVMVDNEFIKETWHQLYRKHFMQQSLNTATDCKKGFYYYQQGFGEQHGMECHDVVLFWRIERMLKVTSNALRQQVVNNEARRLERNIKTVLDDLSDEKPRWRNW